jgi:hypothetical protein
VPALRSLGLGLESIAVCLDAGVDPARLVRDHLAEVEAVAAELDRRRIKLRRLVEALDDGRVPDTAALLDAVRASTASPRSWPAISTRTRWRRCGPAPRPWARWPTTSWTWSGRSCTGGPSGTASPASRPTTRGCSAWRGLGRYLDLARQRRHNEEEHA